MSRLIIPVLSGPTPSKINLKALSSVKYIPKDGTILHSSMYSDSSALFNQITTEVYSKNQLENKAFCLVDAAHVQLPAFLFFHYCDIAAFGFSPCTISFLQLGKNS